MSKAPIDRSKASRIGWSLRARWMMRPSSRAGSTSARSSTIGSSSWACRARLAGPAERSLFSIGRSRAQAWAYSVVAPGRPRDIVVRKARTPDETTWLPPSRLANFATLLSLSSMNPLSTLEAGVMTLPKGGKRAACSHIRRRHEPEYPRCAGRTAGKPIADSNEVRSYQMRQKAGASLSTAVGSRRLCRQDGTAFRLVASRVRDSVLCVGCDGG
jgi:hypothetical protein